jgi:hypothetical protein
MAHLAEHKGARERKELVRRTPRCRQLCMDVAQYRLFPKPLRANLYEKNRGKPFTTLHIRTYRHAAEVYLTGVKTTDGRWLMHRLARVGR